MCADLLGCPCFDVVRNCDIRFVAVLCDGFEEALVLLLGPVACLSRLRLNTFGYQCPSIFFAVRARVHIIICIVC